MTLAAAAAVATWMITTSESVESTFLQYYWYCRSGLNVTSAEVANPGRVGRKWQKIRAKSAGFPDRDALLNSKQRLRALANRRPAADIDNDHIMTVLN
jgi:hypothetical protein